MTEHEYDEDNNFFLKIIRFHYNKERPFKGYLYILELGLFLEVFNQQFKFSGALKKLQFKMTNNIRSIFSRSIPFDSN